MYKYIVTILITLASLAAKAQTGDDPKVAFVKASETGKPILLIFQGSDWCLPCMKLERHVFATDTFIRFANEHLVVLKADFPQRKKLEPFLVKAYEALAEQFNPQGNFPELLLISPSNKVIARISKDLDEPGPMIAKLQELLKRYHEEM